MAKGLIRSMRFSDDMIELIERQNGDTFTAKFEALVTKCVFELPHKEEELHRIQQQIVKERKNLQRLVAIVNSLDDMQRQISGVKSQFQRIEDAANRIGKDM